MNSAGNCVDIPTFVGSMQTCGGEYIGVDEGGDHYNSLTMGNCNDPAFSVGDTLFAGNRHIYIDEI
jgi:hypothetical protein